MRVGRPPDRGPEGPPPGIEVLTSLEGLERLRAQWSALWSRVPAATPFQSPEWLLPWWSHIGEGELWTLALRAPADGLGGGRLVGLAPFYLYRPSPEAPRRLFPLGIATSDYLDLLLLPGWEAAGMRAVFAHLDAHRDRWDLCELPQLRAGSPLLAAPVPPGWRDTAAPAEPCLALDLPERIEELPRRLPPGIRHNLRYYRRRAEQAGAVRFLEADGGSFGRIFAAHVALHRLRWRARGAPGVMARGEIVKANEEAARGLLERGLLRLYALELKGRIIATLYAFADRGQAPQTAAMQTAQAEAALPRRPPASHYYYLGAFDPAFGRLSPGALLIGHAVEQAVARGARTFDFLSGREPYKLLWGARERPTWRRTLRHGGS